MWIDFNWVTISAKPCKCIALINSYSPPAHSAKMVKRFHPNLSIIVLYHPQRDDANLITKSYGAEQTMCHQAQRSKSPLSLSQNRRHNLCSVLHVLYIRCMKEVPKAVLYTRQAWSNSNKELIQIFHYQPTNSGMQRYRNINRPLFYKKKPERSGVSLLIDIENCIKAQQSAGYERWAKIENLKRAARTMVFLDQHGISHYNRFGTEDHGSSGQQRANCRCAENSRTPPV